MSPLVSTGAHMHTSHTLKIQTHKSGEIQRPFLRTRFVNGILVIKALTKNSHNIQCGNKCARTQVLMAPATTAGASQKYSMGGLQESDRQ